MQIYSGDRLLVKDSSDERCKYYENICGLKAVGSETASGSAALTPQSCSASPSTFLSSSECAPRSGRVRGRIYQATSWGPSSRWSGHRQPAASFALLARSERFLNKKRCESGCRPNAHEIYRNGSIPPLLGMCDCAYLCAILRTFLIENHSLRRRPSASSRNVRPRASERSAPSAFRTAGRPDSPTSRKSGSSGSWTSRGTS